MPDIPERPPPNPPPRPPPSPPAYAGVMIVNAVATLIAARMCLVFIVVLLDRSALPGLHPLIRAPLRVSSTIAIYFRLRHSAARLSSIRRVIGSHEPKAICQITALGP